MFDCDCFSPSCRRKLEIGEADNKTAPGMVPLRIHGHGGNELDGLPTVWLDYSSISELIRGLREAQVTVIE